MFEHPRNFGEKFDTRKQTYYQSLNFQNKPLDWTVDIDFGRGFDPDNTGGGLQRSPRFLADGEGAHPASVLRASLGRPQHTRK